MASCLLPHYGVIGASMFMQQQYAENQILALVGQPTKSYCPGPPGAVKWPPSWRRVPSKSLTRV